MSNLEERYKNFTFACGSGNKENIRRYFDKKYINGLPDYHMTPLLAAYENYDYSTIEYLLKNGASPNHLIKDGDSFYPIIFYIIDTQMDNYYEAEGYLKYEDLRKDFFELLIQYGADLNLKDSDGRTPLDLAIERDHKPAINLFRKHGAKTSKELEEENKKE